MRRVDGYILDRPGVCLSNLTDISGRRETAGSTTSTTQMFALILVEICCFPLFFSRVPRGREKIATMCSVPKLISYALLFLLLLSNYDIGVVFRRRKSDTSIITRSCVSVQWFIRVCCVHLWAYLILDRLTRVPSSLPCAVIAQCSGKNNEACKKSYLSERARENEKIAGLLCVQILHPLLFFPRMQCPFSGRNRRAEKKRERKERLFSPLKFCRVLLSSFSNPLG